MNHILVMWLEANFMTYTATEMAKHTSRRARPYVYNPEVDISEKTKINARLSFFSGHAAQTAANSFFAAKIFSDYFPDSKLKPWVWATAVTLPAISAYGRVQAGRHFPTDVLTGFIVGAAFGYLIPKLHEINSSDDYHVSLVSSGTGVLFRLEF